MGRNGLSSLLQLSDMSALEGNYPPDTLERQFDFASLSAINQSLETMYGQKGGRGIALRIGMASFSQGMKNFGALRGMGHPVFKALPLEERVELGLQGLANVLTHFTDQISFVTAEDNAYLFHSEICPFAYGRTSDKPVCHAMVGILQECLRWASNGYDFYVREVQCRAMGHEACVFRINRTAIGETHR